MKVTATRSEKNCYIMTVPIRESLDTRICLVGKTRTDANVISAAQKFGVPVVSSETGAEFLNDGSWDTVYVVGDFSGPVYEAIHRSEQRVLGPTALQQCSERGEGLPNNARPLYTMAMCGLIVCFTGFRKKDELTRLISLIHNMGGSIRKDMVSKVTHLIANQSGGDKYQYAVTFRVPIMAESWVHTCWERRNDPAVNALTDDMMACHKLLPLQGAHVCFHGFPDDERDHMAEVLVENGGISVDLEDFTCTHVVADSEETFNILKANLGLPNDPAHSPKSTFETNDLTTSVYSPVRHLSSESWHTSTPDQGTPVKVPSPIPLSPVQQLKESESLNLTLVEAHQNFAINNQQPVTSLSCRKSKVFSSFSKKNRCRASLPGPGYFLRRCKIPAPIFLNTLPKITSEHILMEEDETDVDVGEIVPPPRYNTPKLRRLSGTSAGHPGSCSFLSCPESSGNPSTIQEEDQPLTMVVDESIVQNIPEKAPLKAAIVKVEWFWASIQNEVCSDEKDYLFEDYLESLLSPGRNSAHGTPGSSTRPRKRKRLRDTMSRLLQTESPAVQKRRSSVSDAGFLSVSGSFLDTTPGSPDTLVLEVEQVTESEIKNTLDICRALCVFVGVSEECVGEKSLGTLEKEIKRSCDVCVVEEERDSEEDPVAADTPRKNLTARQQVFIELLQTEINYVNILDTIMKAWIQTAELFNATLSAGLHHIMQQLSAKYTTLKKSVKKIKSTLKQQEYVTDGGPYNPPKFEDGDVLDAIEMLMPDATGGLSTRSDSDTLYEGPDDLTIIDTNSGSHLYKVENVCMDLPKLTPTNLQPSASDDERECILDLDEEAEMDIGEHNLPAIVELDNNNTAGSRTESRRQSPSATFQQAASSVNSKNFASMAEAKKDLAILQMELLKREYKIREAHMIEIHELDVKIKRAQLEILLDQKKVDVARL
uniref:BRCT domain-containing protein n=1 Tax=Timema bartmani TaxID=61472 RepID=A0A7R9EY01_9NEOP|nr:unnamed protein product [Timema bartmani]